MKSHMPKCKFYVVWNGRKTGIFTKWNECAEQIKGFQGAIYKAFADQAEAEKAFKSDYRNYIGINIQVTAKKTAHMKSPSRPIRDCLCVDAACSGNPGMLEYQGVNLKTNEVVFRKGPFELGTVNLGEFLAIVHALAYLKKKKSLIPVYSDSHTAIKWVKDRAVKTNLARTPASKPLFDLIDRALIWLNENEYENPVLKWQTQYWGEIPADFGRK